MHPLPKHNNFIIISYEIMISDMIPGYELRTYNWVKFWMSLHPVQSPVKKDHILGIICLILENKLITLSNVGTESSYMNISLL